MARIDASYKQQLETDPGQQVAVIIRTKGQADALRAQVSARGLTVTQQYSLIPGLAANGPASAVLKLLDEDWVSSIEPDQNVHTMGG
jgi:hypothetical protein